MTRPHLLCISIHAAREGGDYLMINTTAQMINFNPRRP